MTWMPGTLCLSETLLSLMLQREEVSQHNLIMYISLRTQMVAAVAILHLLVCNAPVEPTTQFVQEIPLRLGHTRRGIPRKGWLAKLALLVTKYHID